MWCQKKRTCRLFFTPCLLSTSRHFFSPIKRMKYFRSMLSLSLSIFTSRTLHLLYLCKSKSKFLFDYLSFKNSHVISSRVLVRASVHVYSLANIHIALTNRTHNRTDGGNLRRLLKQPTSKEASSSCLLGGSGLSKNNETILLKPFLCPTAWE